MSGMRAAQDMCVHALHFESITFTESMGAFVLGWPRRRQLWGAGTQIGIAVIPKQNACTYRTMRMSGDVNGDGGAGEGGCLAGSRSIGLTLHYTRVANEAAH